MRSAATKWLAVLEVCGCGPRVDEPPAECRGDGPTQLVELKHGSMSALYPTGVRDEHGWLFFDGDEHEGRNIAVACGERPRVFARDIPIVYRLDPRGPWLGFAQLPDDPPGNFVLDPWGSSAPRALPRSFLGRFDDGLLLGESSSADGVRLWHAKFGDAFELEPVALERSVSSGRGASWAGHSFVISAVEMLFITLREDEVTTTIGIDPGTGATRLTESRAFVESKMGGRFVVLRDDYDAYGAARYTIVNTREPSRHGDPFFVGSRCCGWTGADMVAAAHYVNDEIVETTLVLLPEMRELRLQGSWSQSAVVVGSASSNDGTRVVRGPEGFYVLEPNAEVPALLYPGDGWGRIVGDTFWLEPWVPPDDEGIPYDRRSVVAVPLDGSPPRTVLDLPLAGYMALDGELWAVQRSLDEGRADLRILDAATGHEEVVLEAIDVGFARWNTDGLYMSRWFSPWVEPSSFADEVVFARSSAEGTTLWRFAP